ncbi:MAG TPA: DAK2 domain-containing protein [Solirubrobacteraceae bacterium]|nr:DAK2 domain-containing protein [Solirubrobacteraceae bacterium]
MAEQNLERFRTVVKAALAQLEERRGEVNDLNVFPVADGDTGDNMALTLSAVVAELDRLAGDGGRTIDEIGREEIVESVARAALLGARGNSGVILSQLIRGAAEELASRPGELVDPVLVGAAMARAADRAYASVRDPAEGTILTVVREMAHRIASDLAHMPETRLGPDAPPEVQDAALAEILEGALRAGDEALKRGPDLLPVLREAGVVDAGGYAVTIIFAGIVAALRGADPPLLDHHAPARITHPQHDSSTYRYCTNFAVTGSDLGDATKWGERLEGLGDSVLVVGDPTTLKIHVHTDEPERATELFEAEGGSVSHLDVADMRVQIAERDERLAATGNGGGARAAAARRPAACGALAVVAGDGMRALFEGLGLYALDGGPTLNPSTYDLLAGIHAVPAEAVVVLPNSPNVVMAAERAADLSDKRVVVVPTRSQQAGLAAAVALEPGHDVDANADGMRAALEGVRTGAVARAARDDGKGRFHAGDAVGFVDEQIVAWGEPETTLRAVFDHLGGDAELLTCIAGDGAPLPEARVLQLAPDGVELEWSDGGQPAYWWLVAAE